MTEKVLQKNKNGMSMLLLSIALYLIAVVAIIGGANAFGSQPIVNSGSLY